MAGDPPPPDDPPREPDRPAPEPVAPRRHRRRRVVIGAIAAVCAAFLVGIAPRLAERATVSRETADLAVPYVAVIRPERASPIREIVLPGNVEAYVSAPIFSRISGYLSQWFEDIGEPVKQGQLLAEIDTPEVDQQLEQARGTLAVAEANLRVSEITAKRFTELRNTNSVSRQEVDNAVGTLQANRATVFADRASVRQLEQQKAFSQIRAPFDGVITARNVDMGDLITAGSSTNANTALFQLAQADKLRVFVNVPEVHALSVDIGLPATLALGGMPGRRFEGKVVRTANAIDSSLRTLLVEVEVNNPTGELLTGSFAQVTLVLPATGDRFVVPAETLVFRDAGLQIATVQDGRIVLKPVTPGHDFGDRIEIEHGLTAEDWVVVNPPDSISTGDPVRVVPARGSAAQAPHR